MTVNRTERSGFPDYMFRYADWDQAHVQAWVAQGQRLRNREIRRWVAGFLRRLGTSVEALVVSPITRGRMIGAGATAAGRHRTGENTSTLIQDREQAFWTAYRPARVPTRRRPPATTGSKAA
ncbi:MAG: hypothetical protein EA406_01425 [Rhodospirillales bacterium]|nr:MAG: hypothetical protein EA406_01425 [Rhodospirillales bacterium]